MPVRKPYHRVGFTAAQSAELWERWKTGSGVKAIARALGKLSHSSILAHMYPTGGIRPPARRRSRLALSLAEREEISRGVIAGRSVRAMAEAMDRAPSTISREIARNGGRGIPRSGGRQTRMEASAAPEIVQAGDQFPIAAECCGKA